jgi:hypothetical protein
VPGDGEDGTGASGSGTVPDTTEAAATVDAVVAPPMPETIAVAPPELGLAVVDASAKAQHCAELEANQKWQDLKDCASELAALGAHDRGAAVKAEEFRQKAFEETANLLATSHLRDAIAEGNLREAQRLLKSIGSHSVYFPAVNEAFHAAETRAVDETRWTARMLADANDCAGVKRLQAMVNTISTTTVYGAVAVVAAKCVER